MRAVERAITILKCFTPDTLELGTTEIARRADIPKATAYRILAALAKGGLLDQSNQTKNYRIGPQLYMLGTMFLNKADIISAATPVTKMLNDLTGETVHVSIYNHGNVVIIMKEESRHAFRVSQHIGTVVPSHTSAMGKAFLSQLTEAELDELIPEESLAPVTPKSITTKTDLKQDLAAIRKCGVALDREGTMEAIIGTGALIRDVAGRAVAAVGMPFPVFRLDQDEIEHILHLVKMGAALISYRLGYQDSSCTVGNTEEMRAYWEGLKEKAKA
jgi:DNA-binding IclR family transcriptional regulator